MTKPVTWQQIIDAAKAQDTGIGVQGIRAESLTVWINALVASAGGQIIENPEAPAEEVKLGLETPAGEAAATIMGTIGKEGLGGPGLPTEDENASLSVFQGDKGSFMVNWPFVYSATQAAVEDGTLDPALLEDIGWALYPQVTQDQPSAPPYGGINLGIGAFSHHKEQGLQAVRCITSLESQTQYMLKSKNPGARAAVYDNAEVRKVFPMADDLRASLAEGAPRPRTPYYTDVSTAVQRSFHPPASVDPAKAPAKAAKLIVDVLKDKVLL
jgi:multiple sugar transport system substrate-binding protein